MVSGLSSATTYNFYVKAKDAAGNLSLPSNTITVTTVKAIVTPIPTPTVTPAPTPDITPAPVTSTNRVVGYYAAWSAYSGFTPDKIDARKLTHINYAFANIGSDLKIALGYPDIDLANFEKLKALKQINANLKSDVITQYKWSTDAGMNAWLKAGFPAEKLVMGVPFYGYIYKMTTNINNGLYQKYSGCASISYANIAGNYLNNPTFVRYIHTESKVPWLFDGSTFISYEDQQSIALKAQYMKMKGFGGAMIWELSQDPNGVLLNSLYNNMQ